MSKLNKPGQAPKAAQKTAVSFNGNPQYLKDAEMQLYEVVTMTLYGKDEFYETSDTRLQRLKQLVASTVASDRLDFIGNLIVHARTAMNIRSMPVILAVEFAKALRDQKKTYPNLRQVTCDVIQRADQITDLYSYALATFGSKKAIPMAIKRGVADAFEKFDEYSLAKYNRSGAVKLRDVLRIVHPTGKTLEQGALFQKLMKDELAVPYTWETELSKNGQLPASERKSDAVLWKELVESNKVPYMATLRNVRNIAQAQVDDSVIKQLCARLSDPRQVERSKQLPFRYINALDALAQAGNAVRRTDADRLSTAIREAAQISLSNVPAVGDNVWIILDVSGSMGGGYGGFRAGGNQTPIRTGALFAAALVGASKASKNVQLTVFSDRAKHVKLNPAANFFANVDAIEREVIGGGTELQAALNLKKTLGFEPDTVIVLSDMQVNQLRTSTDVSQFFTKDTVKVAFNLNAYNSTPVSTLNGWYQLAGWSERAFDFIPAMREKVSVVDYLSRPYMGVEKIKKRKSEVATSDEE
jgi:hypothetical protein